MATKNNKLDEMLDQWDDVDEGVEEDVETVGYDSNRIEGYGVADVKVTMAKLINVSKKKVQFIELDFQTKDGKELRERFMIRGSDGKTFYVYKGKKKQHFGVSKIKSLINVAGLYKGEANKMKELFSNTETAEVEFKEYGKDVKQDYTVFTDLIGVKVKIAVKSKKENSQTGNDDDDKYILSCTNATEQFKKDNPKKKSAQKFKADDKYVNVYKWFTVTEVAHFISADGLLASEIESGEGVLMEKYIGMNNEGEVFDVRTLIVENLSEGERKKLGIDEFGKIVEDDEGEDGEEPEEPEEEEVEDSGEEW